jgi:hypothetical protein
MLLRTFSGFRFSASLRVWLPPERCSPGSLSSLRAPRPSHDEGPWKALEVDGRAHSKPTIRNCKLGTFLGPST